MFTQLIFLILFLLVVNLAPEASAAYWGVSPGVAFWDGLILYVAVLLLVAAQNALVVRRYAAIKDLLTPLVQIEAVLFFLVYHFLFASHRLYLFLPGTIFSLISVAMYFGILAVHHASYYSRTTLLFRARSRWEFATLQLRFLLPFIIPFLCFELLFDVLEFLPYAPLQELMRHEGDPLVEAILFTAVTLVFLVGMLIFLPALIQRLWGCEPLESRELEERLERLCTRARFKHAGMKRWTILRSSHTAAIIGIVSRFRYVMFTDGLIQRLTTEEVEAVLAHEIGHSYRRHLLIYPFIILGLMVFSGLFSLFFLDPLFIHLALREHLGSKAFWEAVRPLALFIPYALIAVGYFRLVFGLFSRNFERQADLHPLHLGLPSKHMISALYRVALASGEPVDRPNWHHYSIRERMDFLESVELDPALSGRHHRYVRKLLYGYFLLLSLGLAVLLSPLLSAFPVASHLARGVDTVSGALSDWANGGMRSRVTAHMIQNYALEGDRSRITGAIGEVLREPLAVYVDGLAELLAAQELSIAGEHRAALRLMAYAWLRFDFRGMGQEVYRDFARSTEQVLNAAGDGESYRQEIQFLLDSRDQATKNLLPGDQQKQEISYARSKILFGVPKQLLRRA